MSSAGCFPAPLPLVHCTPSVKPKVCKPTQLSVLLAIGPDLTAGMTPLYNALEAPVGSVTVQTSGLYLNDPMTRYASVGSYTLSQNMISFEKESRTLFDAWLVFTNESQMIHIQWYSNSAGSGRGVVTGGTGSYACATGTIDVTLVDDMPVDDGRLVINAFKIQLTLTAQCGCGSGCNTGCSKESRCTSSFC